MLDGSKGCTTINDMNNHPHLEEIVHRVAPRMVECLNLSDVLLVQKFPAINEKFALITLEPVLLGVLGTQRFLEVFYLCTTRVFLRPQCSRLCHVIVNWKILWPPKTSFLNLLRCLKLLRLLTKNSLLTGCCQHPVVGCIALYYNADHLLSLGQFFATRCVDIGIGFMGYAAFKAGEAYMTIRIEFVKGGV